MKIKPMPMGKKEAPIKKITGITFLAVSIGFHAGNNCCFNGVLLGLLVLFANLKALIAFCHVEDILQVACVPLISHYIMRTIFNSSSRLPKIVIVNNMNKSNVVEGHIEESSLQWHLSRCFLTLVKH